MPTDFTPWYLDYSIVLPNIQRLTIADDKMIISAKLKGTDYEIEYRIDVDVNSLTLSGSVHVSSEMEPDSWTLLSNRHECKGTDEPEDAFQSLYIMLLEHESDLQRKEAREKRQGMEDHVLGYKPIYEFGDDGETVQQAGINAMEYGEAGGDIAWDDPRLES